MLIKVFKVHSINYIEELSVEIESEYHMIMTKEKLKLEQNKIIKILRDLQNKGIIKSIYIPKNKKIQDKLDNIVKIKKEIKKSIEKISILI